MNKLSMLLMVTMLILMQLMLLATTNSFKIKEKITGETFSDDTKSVEIMVPLKYLSNFSRPLEMHLINCE